MEEMTEQPPEQIDILEQQIRAQQGNAAVSEVMGRDSDFIEAIYMERSRPDRLDKRGIWAFGDPEYSLTRLDEGGVSEMKHYQIDAQLTELIFMPAHEVTATQLLDNIQDRSKHAAKLYRSTGDMTRDRALLHTVISHSDRQPAQQMQQKKGFFGWVKSKVF